MMKWFLVISWISIAASSHAQEAAWQVFSPPDSSFVVRLPGRPKTSMLFTDTKEGLLPIHMASFNPTLRDEFMVAWTEYRDARVSERASDELLVRMRDALVLAKDAEVVADSALTFADRPARATTLRTQDGRIVRVRFYFVGNRSFQLIADTGDDSRSSADATRFLGSFLLLRTRRPTVASSRFRTVSP